MSTFLPSSEAATTDPAAATSPSPGRTDLWFREIMNLPLSTWLAAALMTVLVCFLYSNIAVKLVHDWLFFPDYSHGLLIPFFVLFLLWDKRHIFASTPVQPSWAGLPLVVLAMFVMLTGVFGADLFLSRFSFVMLTGGVIWTMAGLGMLRKWAYVLFVFFLAIPLPAVLLNHITFPLQIFASELSSGLLPLAGVPVLREGNIITLPAMPLEVAEACSGIRSLMSLFTVAVIYGYLMEKRTLIRVLLALASLPIAVFANVARICGTGLCVQYWDPVKALGFFHEFSGWLLFLVSLTCLYFTHKALVLLIPGKGAAQ